MIANPPAVFLDRDGTMIHDPGYLCRLDELRWYPWTIDAVRLLNRAGFLVFVTTNQGGVGLGLTIARDVVRGHGGDLVLADSPLGGLRVRATVPV